MCATSTVFLNDFLNRGSNTNQDVGGPFHHSGYFFVFNSFDDIIRLNGRQDLSPKSIVVHQFYSRWLLAALATAAMKMRDSVIALAGGGSGSKAVWPALPDKRLIWAIWHQKLPDRIAVSKIFVFYVSSPANTTLKSFALCILFWTHITTTHNIKIKEKLPTRVSWYHCTIVIMALSWGGHPDHRHHNHPGDKYIFNNGHCHSNDTITTIKAWSSLTRFVRKYVLSRYTCPCPLDSRYIFINNTCFPSN